MSQPDPFLNPQSTAAQHIRWSEVAVESVSPLFDRQLVVGEKMMVARISLKKGCVVPMHQHHHEQISFVETGALQFVVNGKEMTVRAGEMLSIPPNAPHMATALEDSIDIDIFTPPREDWINKTDDYLRR